MGRRRFLTSVGAATAGLACSGWTSARAAGGGRPAKGDYEATGFFRVETRRGEVGGLRPRRTSGLPPRPEPLRRRHPHAAQPRRPARDGRGVADVRAGAPPRVGLQLPPPLGRPLRTDPVRAPAGADRDGRTSVEGARGHPPHARVGGRALRRAGVPLRPLHGRAEAVHVRDRPPRRVLRRVPRADRPPGARARRAARREPPPRRLPLRPQPAVGRHQPRVRLLDRQHRRGRGGAARMDVPHAPDLRHRRAVAGSLRDADLVVRGDHGPPLAAPRVRLRAAGARGPDRVHGAGLRAVVPSVHRGDPPVRPGPPHPRRPQHHPPQPPARLRRPHHGPLRRRRLRQRDGAGRDLLPASSSR